MSEETLKRYNPLELSTEEVGYYLQRMPKDTFEAICFAMPKSIQNARVLYWFVKESVNNTYTIGKHEEQPVSVIANSLGERLGILGTNMSRTLKKLRDDGWIRKGDKKGLVTTYYVNYPKVIRALSEYKEKFNPTKKKTVSSIARDRHRRGYHHDNCTYHHDNLSSFLTIHKTYNISMLQGRKEQFPLI